MMLNCILIEDEPLAQERVRGFVAKLPFLNLKAVFDDASDALAFLQSEPVDVLFLDINLGGISGIELLESAQIDAAVIITTAYDAYALKGYDLNVSDYLLKPYTFERFVQAVEKVRTVLSSKESPKDVPQIFVKTENRLEKVEVSEILFIEGMRDYRRIHLPDRRIMTLQKFSEFEEIIPVHQVARVHKSYMVGLANIETIERSRIVIGKTNIPISETYRKAFFELIKA